MKLDLSMLLLQIKFYVMKGKKINVKIHLRISPLVTLSETWDSRDSCQIESLPGQSLL